jgi:Holliday junction resolvase RusA-like endonuclease
MNKKITLTYRGAVLSKKNSKRVIRNRSNGKIMLVSNKAAKNNENDMTDQFRMQTLGQTSPIEKCEISIALYEPNKQRRDLDNQATSILDSLVRAEVIQDDSYKCVVAVGVKFAGIDRKDPRAEITITEVEQNDE